MQVNGPTAVHGPQAISSPHRAQATTPNKSSSGLAQVDQLDISPEASFVSQARDVAEVRSDRVAAVRAAIESGTYETSEKIDMALDRLLDEIA